MQQRTIWIRAGVIIGMAALICAIGIGGLLIEQRLRQQQQELTRLRATVDTAIELPAPDATSSALTPPTPTAEDATTHEPSQQPATPGPALIETDLPALPSETAPDLRAALAAPYQDALVNAARVPLYRIAARLDPVRQQIAGHQEVRLTNTEDGPLNELYFRLYANAPHYAEGGISVADVQVNGAPAAAKLELDDTALKVALPQPLAPGQNVALALDFRATVPKGGGYGIFRVADGIFTLYNWHPELAVYENGGWLLNPVTDQGDPTNTDSANYLVAFAAPASYQIISSGIEGAPTSDDQQTLQPITGALIRNLVIVAGERFELSSQQSGTTTINSYYLPADKAGGQTALDAAVASLEVFGKRFGPYAYPELDVLEVRLSGGAGGMESTGLIMLGRDFYDPEQSETLASLQSLVKGADKLSMLGFITAHETAHQWWYGMVGSDAYLRPWLDEGLTNWSAAMFIDETAGSDAGLLARDMFISMPYRSALMSGDQRLDQPVDQFSHPDYAAIVYGKGALMYDVLRSELGEERFWTFMRRYFEDHRFQRVDGAGWRATLAQVAGEDLTKTFFDKWVIGDDIREDDLPLGGPVSELLGGLGDLNQLTDTPELEEQQ